MRNVVSEAGTLILAKENVPSTPETTKMKLSKADVRGKAKPGMELRFERQNLTSYSGLILFQHFFACKFLPHLTEIPTTF